MNRRWIGWLAALGVSVLLGAGGPASADEPTLGELRERFQERYAEVLRAKNAGEVGETWQGYLEVVDDEFEDGEHGERVRELVSEENDDRRTLYRLIAEREEVEPERVARRNAARNFERANAGHYLKRPSEDNGEEWVRKQEDED